MLRTITPSEMKRIESCAIASGRCTGQALMQTAAAAVCDAVCRLLPGAQGVVVALCGTGNNGGDAMAALRMLGERGRLRQGVCLLLPGTLTADARRELAQLEATCPQVAVFCLDGEPPIIPEQLPPGQPGVDCIIDGLFGTGLCRPVTGPAAALCRLSNAAFADGVPVVAVDIPSGLCGRTGQLLGESIRATETVTFHRPKPGLYLGQGLEVCGRVTVAPIGLPEGFDDADGLLIAAREELAGLLPPWGRTGHKGDHGRVVLLCGSVGMAGAAAIAATAALRSGAGLVTVACPEQILDVVQALCPCATCLPLSGDATRAWAQLEALLPAADALGAGCGLGQSPWAQALLEPLLEYLIGHALPAVLDADALNLLAASPRQEWELSRCVLTPHPGEAARLLDCTVADVLADPVAAAAQLHGRYGAALVLKGAASVLTDGQQTALNLLGTPAMGKGGSGDALTGVLCALLACNARLQHPQPVLGLLQAGCGLHGVAGLLAEQHCGQRGVLATDLCRYLGCAAG